MYLIVDKEKLSIAPIVSKNTEVKVGVHWGVGNIFTGGNRTSSHVSVMMLVNVGRRSAQNVWMVEH